MIFCIKCYWDLSRSSITNGLNSMLCFSHKTIVWLQETRIITHKAFMYFWSLTAWSWFIFWQKRIVFHKRNSHTGFQLWWGIQLWQLLCDNPSNSAKELHRNLLSKNCSPTRNEWKENHSYVTLFARVYL